MPRDALVNLKDMLTPADQKGNDSDSDIDEGVSIILYSYKNRFTES